MDVKDWFKGDKLETERVIPRRAQLWDDYHRSRQSSSFCPVCDGHCNTLLHLHRSGFFASDLPVTPSDPIS